MAKNKISYGKVISGQIRKAGASEMVEMEIMAQLSREAGKEMTAELIRANEKAAQFGLALSQGEMEYLVKRRTEELRLEQRIEFGTGILPKLMEAFCDSPYIYQDNYAETLERLQEIFYLYKNESMDECTDDELLEQMKESFDGVCEGSLDYLESTALEEFARRIRAESRRFFGNYAEKEDENGL